VFHGALERGVYLAPSGYEVGFIGAAHTTALLDEAIVKIVAAAEAAAST
jgi:glutamate-1-semialdehyde 2,1-aminomutase